MGLIERHAISPDDLGPQESGPKGVLTRIDLLEQYRLLGIEGLAQGFKMSEQGRSRLDDEHQQDHRRRERTAAKYQQALIAAETTEGLKLGSGHRALTDRPAARLMRKLRLCVGEFGGKVAQER
ncbi:hypothetical protein [Pseudomonas sp. D(2018)]|uniref:hypothetical protein n=1 Tax=Pseudomonas sp. D(2018) TaxID=2502238 RepID=UPI0014859E8A|nr:hypothetical protein [Pseudomonas sp. D(2018)]